MITGTHPTKARIASRNRRRLAIAALAGLAITLSALSQAAEPAAVQAAVDNIAADLR